MLNLRVPLAPFETPSSFLSRLAKRNGCSYARDLCRNLSVDFQGVIDARPGTLNQLAELGGVNADTLHRHAVRRVASKAYEIGAEPIGPTAVRRETLRFCPACLLNDIEAAGDRRDSAPAGRSMWQVRSIRTCHTHGLPLVDMPCPSYRLRNDFVFGLEAIPGFSGLLVDRAKVPARSPGGLEFYLHARLFGAGKGDTWPDTIEVTAVARAAEIFGAVARQGVDVAVATLSEDQLHESGELGFDIVSGGQASITAFLRTIQDARGLAGAAGAQAVFGQIYRWLASSTEGAIAPIRKVVREHIVETMSFAAGDMVLGEPVLQRRVYSV